MQKKAQEKYSDCLWAAAAVSLFFVAIPVEAEANCILAVSGLSALIATLLFILCICCILWHGVKFFCGVKKGNPAHFFWMLGYIFVFILYAVAIQFGISQFKNYDPYSDTFESLDDYRYYHLFVAEDLDGSIIRSLFYFTLAGMMIWGMKRAKIVLALFSIVWLSYAAFYARNIYDIFQRHPRNCSAVHKEASQRGLSDVSGCRIREKCIADQKTDNNEAP